MRQFKNFKTLKMFVLRIGPLVSKSVSKENYINTGRIIVARPVKKAGEELQPDDSVDDDHEQHQEGDVEQRHHGLQD